ncbi:MAG: nucleotidyltransferase family protein [Vulcanococcus sp.]
MADPSSLNQRAWLMPVGDRSLLWDIPVPWQCPDLGPGLSTAACEPLLQQLSADPATKALVLFGSRARGEADVHSDLDLLLIRREPLDPAAQQRLWRQARHSLGALPVDLDLLIEDEEQARRLSGSRWHVLGRIAHEGRVLYAS